MQGRRWSNHAYKIAQGVGVGEEENSSLFFFLARFARELADVFEKNEKKYKTTSVYRLSQLLF